MARVAIEGWLQTQPGPGGSLAALKRRSRPARAQARVCHVQSSLVATSAGRFGMRMRPRRLGMRPGTLDDERAASLSVPVHTCSMLSNVAVTAIDRTASPQPCTVQSGTKQAGGLDGRPDGASSQPDLNDQI
ncbi:hypothetical protein MHUMG1_04451 [Metarhizium humberi]|uniref:Uncharacterized protein n=1 Tax=Metarhizium humberi TaxID=2596975 RepID=A0A9P8S825_9HYPO|nr:hypothetical protein MHUMG1_04451 [Metarhizium humberi]